MRGLADTARQFLGANYEPARDFFWSLFALSERTTAAWIACYLLLALLVFARDERRPGEAFLAGFRRYLFPKEVYAHPSARADFVYFAGEKVLFFVALETLAVSGDLVTVRLLQAAQLERVPDRELHFVQGVGGTWPRMGRLLHCARQRRHRPSRRQGIREARGGL